jgi:glycosyltransferase involved in cell wall biosynthesis
MNEAQRKFQLSVIVPVGSRHGAASELYAEYKAGLDALGQSYEIIFVLDGRRDEFEAGLKQMLAAGERFTVVGLTREFGEATALMAGFELAKGDAIVTLPAYHQIEAQDVAKLVEALGTSDVVIGRRWPRAGGPLERARRWLFHGLLAWVTKLQFHDLGCGARTRNFLDLFTVFFLVRFTKKPLRFFGMVGVTTFAIGALTVMWLLIDRVFFAHGLASRPALLLSSLLVVLGLQLFALGLLGELIIFTHARSIKDYKVERVFGTDRG